MRITITPPPEFNLRGLDARVRAAALQAARAGTQMVANDMRRSVMNGPKSGRIYTEYLRTSPTGGIYPIGPRPPHQASAPGEVPASDTGRLAASIAGDAAIQGDNIIAAVRANVLYARYLEYGTRKIAPRPFIVPAVERNRQRVVGLMRAAIRKATEGLGRR